jgi:hypothetical protein
VAKSRLVAPFVPEHLDTLRIAMHLGRRAPRPANRIRNAHGRCPCFALRQRRGAANA